MPLYGSSYFSSSSYFQALARNPRAGLAAVRLWWHAWHQVPAASLPSDDLELALMADFGADIDAWLACKDIALRGFVLCSDNRLYHKTLAEIATEKFALRQRKAANRKKSADRLRKWRKTNAEKQESPVPPPHEETGGETPLNRADPERTGTEGAMVQPPPPEEGGNIPTQIETHFSSSPETHSVSRVESESESESETDHKGQKGRERFTLPHDMPKMAWSDYVDMRKRKRKPMTDRAKALAISKLRKLQEEGHDPEAVLEQSTLHSWDGLFPVRDMKRVSTSVTTHNENAVSNSFARLKETYAK